MIRVYCAVGRLGFFKKIEVKSGLLLLFACGTRRSTLLRFAPITLDKELEKQGKVRSVHDNRIAKVLRIGVTIQTAGHVHDGQGANSDSDNHLRQLQHGHQHCPFGAITTSRQEVVEVHYSMNCIVHRNKVETTN